MGLCGNFTLLVLKLLLDWHVAVITHQKKIPFPLCRNDEFMDKLVNTYIMSSVEQFDLNCTAARVLLNAMPGLESAAVFQDMVSLARYSKSFNSQDLI